MILIVPAAVLALASMVSARPAEAGATVEASLPAKPLITFDNGNVGVNFLGYHASAGLGGLLSGDATAGGLHAEAGTPYGQRAGAGLGGSVGADGKAAGGLFAGATAGGNVAARAGLAGATGAEGSVGTSFAGASNGAVETHITKVSSKPSHAVVAVEKEVAPVKYVEKTIQVPSYVEKTIRVPTYVEKTVRVPVEQPVVYQKAVVKPNLAFRAQFEGGVNAPAPAVEQVKVVHKSKVRPVHHSTVTFHKNFGANVRGSSYGGGYGGSSGVYSANVQKTVNPQVVNDIFNIPISTLGAVSKFLTGLVGNTSGSVAVSKSYGVANNYSF